MRSPLRTLAATTLVLEAMVIFFAALVAKNLSGLTVGQAVGGGGALALLCLLTAGLLRVRAGYAVGWALQAVMIGLGFVVPMMFGIGLIFAGLWAAGLWAGAKVERERAYVEAELARRGDGDGDQGGDDSSL